MFIGWKAQLLKCQLFLDWSILLLFSHQVLSNSETLWTAAHQASLSFTISRSLLKLMSTESVMPSSHVILCHPLLLSPSIFPAWGSFPMNRSLHQVAKVLELQLQPQSFWWIFRIDFHLDWLVWSPCCSRDFQESSPAPQFEGTNSLVFWPSLVLVFFTLGISLPFSLAFHFSSQLFVRPPQTTILPFCISFSWEWSWSLPPVQYHEPPAIVLQILYQI